MLHAEQKLRRERGISKFFICGGSIRSLNNYTHDYRIPAALATVMLEAPSSWVRLPRPSGEPTFRTPSGRIRRFRSFGEGARSRA